MSPRIVLALTLTLGALTVGAVSAIALVDGSVPDAASRAYRGSTLPAKLDLPEFALRGLDGRVVRSGDLVGGSSS